MELDLCLLVTCSSFFKLFEGLIAKLIIYNKVESTQIKFVLSHILKDEKECIYINSTTRL